VGGILSWDKFATNRCGHQVRGEDSAQRGHDRRAASISMKCEEDRDAGGWTPQSPRKFTPARSQSAGCGNRGSCVLGRPVRIVHHNRGTYEKLPAVPATTINPAPSTPVNNLVQTVPSDDLPKITAVLRQVSIFKDRVEVFQVDVILDANVGIRDFTLAVPQSHQPGRAHRADGTHGLRGRARPRCAFSHPEN